MPVGVRLAEAKSFPTRPHLHNYMHAYIHTYIRTPAPFPDEEVALHPERLVFRFYLLRLVQRRLGRALCGKHAAHAYQRRGRTLRQYYDALIALTTRTPTPVLLLERPPRHFGDRRH